MKFLKTALIATLTCSALMLSGTNAFALSLPSGPCDGQTNCIQFTDFSVYSLPFLTYSTGQDYMAASSPGQIKSSIIIGVNNAIDTNPSSVDGAYNTPSANNPDTSMTFSTYGSDPTTGKGGSEVQTWGMGDGIGWDASISELKTQLGNSNLVAFFGFNETGQDNLNGGAMLIWVHAQLRNLTTGAVQDYYLQPTGSELASGPTGPDFVSSNGSIVPWTLVHAGICVTTVSGTKQFSSFPTLNSEGKETCPTNTTLITQSTTGQNDAAFAVYSDALNNQVKNGAWDVLHIDWKMDYLNGGGETAWIAPFDVQNNVPEPASLALVALGLIGMSARRMKVSKTA